MTSDKHNLQRIMKFELGGIDSQFTKQEYEMDIRPLLKLVLSRYFGNSSNCLVDTMVNKFQCAEVANSKYVDNYFVVEDDDQIKMKEQIRKCSTSGPLCINVVKQYYDEIKNEFGVYGRIISGTITTG